MKKYLLLFIAIIVLGAGSHYSQLRFLSYSQSSSPTIATPIAAQGDTLAAPSATSSKLAGIDFTLSVDGKVYSGEIPNNSSILSAMNAVASTSDFRFTYKDFPVMGAFVESINGKREADGYYWILHINGKKADFGVSNAIVHTGDGLEWKYEKGY